MDFSIFSLSSSIILSRLHFHLLWCSFHGEMSWILNVDQVQAIAFSSSSSSSYSSLGRCQVQLTATDETLSVPVQFALFLSLPVALLFTHSLSLSLCVHYTQCHNLLFVLLRFFSSSSSSFCLLPEYLFRCYLC